MKTTISILGRRIKKFDPYFAARDISGSASPGLQDLIDKMVS